MFKICFENIQNTPGSHSEHNQAVLEALRTKASLKKKACLVLNQLFSSYSLSLHYLFPQPSPSTSLISLV